MTDRRGRSLPLRLLVEVLPGLLVVVVPFSVHAGVLDALFGGAEVRAAAPEVVSTTSPLDAPVLTALQNPDPQGARGGGDVFVEDGALVSTGPVGEDEIAASPTQNGEIRVYTVREGDTASEIAEMFGVSVNTIYWANDVTARTIRPGQTLVILPITGVRHTVGSGETLSSIAKKFGGDVDEILSYNQLASADDLTVGDSLVIPNGVLQQVPKKAVAPAAPTKVTGNIAAGVGFAHPLPGSIRTQGLHGYNGVDLAMPGNAVGAAIRAAAAGEVIVAKNSGWNGGYGNYVVVKHANGSQSLYAHMQSTAVGVGAFVGQGETIGYVGNTGRSTGPHLHFEVRGATNPF